MELAIRPPVTSKMISILTGSVTTGGEPYSICEVRGKGHEHVQGYTYVRASVVLTPSMDSVDVHVILHMYVQYILFSKRVLIFYISWPLHFSAL